ncbi:hypothetical protein NEIELOOT_01584 [Neisseria elongata subsp. glycolytica ATCC 29315]|uniref:Uncharacterized protein n=1 Tax=Neisseria elongata subsp. glycolytica ATCC 29315 TaxID=546263 RepID=D4DR91_NEIEG|nr:hypothetical protein NEIELOOT_01584 [Neisseria elongata subsp. glycolytica ATCC 29315]
MIVSGNAASRPAAARQLILTEKYKNTAFLPYRRQPHRKKGFQTAV